MGRIVINAKDVTRWLQLGCSEDLETVKVRFSRSSVHSVCLAEVKAGKATEVRRVIVEHVLCLICSVA
jgi:hypothetical protein